MTLRPPAPLLAAALGLLVAGCTGSLYDAAGVPKVDANGCDLVTQHVCPGLDTTCRDNSNPDYCGHTCKVCPAAPLGGQRACVDQAGAWDCGFTCTAPLRACAARNECLAVGPTACGADCTDCTAPGVTPPGAVATCSAAGTCGYACAEGKFPCASGCCAPAAVAAGGDTTCAITTDGAVAPAQPVFGLACWGKNDAGQLGYVGAGTFNPTPVTGLSSGVQMVAVGLQHACAVKDGVVWCWGSDVLGQLGNDAALASSASPVSTGLSGVAQLVAGLDHTCALVTGGTVRCWGANNVGQLGLGTTGAPAATPAAAITGLTGVSRIAAGGNTTCAVSGTSVKCWGGNGSGQTGKGSSSAAEATPVPVPLPGAATVDLAVGGAHACVGVTGVTAPSGDGLYCWGANDHGQMGYGTVTAAPVLAPTLASKLDNAAAVFLVAAGTAHTCAGKDNAELICNGINSDGNLQSGRAAVGDALDRVAVGLGGGLILNGAAGRDHTCMLMDETGVPVVRCWGRNVEGQLGRDTGGLASAAANPVPGPPPP